MTHETAPADRLMSPEYQAAGYEFFFSGVEALMRALDPLYASLPRVRLETVSATTVDLGDGRTVRAEPIDASTTIALDIPEAIAGRREGLLAAMYVAAETQVQQIMSGFLAHVSEVCEATGNTISGPISWDLIIDGLERTDIVFDDEGNHGMRVVVTPGAGKRLRQQGPPTPEQVARLDAVMARKREEFNARRRHRSIPQHGN